VIPFEFDWVHFQFLILEGRCSIQLSYGRNRLHSNGDGVGAQERTEAGLMDYWINGLMGSAPAAGAVFRALAENPGAQEDSKCS
jgi:hypothetical protein